LIKKRGFPVIFLGWWTLLFAGIWSGLGIGFKGYGISVFFKPLAADLGLSRAVTSIAAGISGLEGSLEAPLTGWLCDRFGPRWPIFTGTLIMAIALALMYFINSLWSYIVVWGILVGFGCNLALTVAVEKVLSNWFVKKRGLAFGIRFMLMSICGVITIPIVTWLVTAYGWRITNLVWAGVMFAGLPLLWFYVKQKRPEYYGLLPDGAKIEGDGIDTSQMVDRGVEYASDLGETEFTLRQAMRTRSYWILVIAWVGTYFIWGAMHIHLIPFLTDRGIELAVASGLMAGMVFFTIPSRLLGGFLTDRISKNRMHLLLVGAFLLQVMGITVFLLNQTIVMIYVFLILSGLGNGATVPLMLSIQGRYFGRKAFASIQGTSIMFAAPASLVAPIYAGWIYDTTGNYITAFITLALLSTLCTVLISLARPPRPPVQVNDISTFV